MPDDLDTSTSVGSITFGVVINGTWTDWDSVQLPIQTTSSTSGTIYTDKEINVTLTYGTIYDDNYLRLKFYGTLNCVNYNANDTTIEMKLVRAVNSMDALITYTAAEVQQLFEDYGENNLT